MKWVLLGVMLDLAQPQEAFFDRLMWVLEGHTHYVSRPRPGEAPQQRRQYWASEGTLRAAFFWAVAGELEDKPQAAAWSMLHPDDKMLGRVDRAFRARFGVPLVKRRRNGFTEYDPAGIRAAFRALYLSPSPRTRLLYAPFRPFVANSAHAASCVLSHRRQMESMARRYAATGHYHPEDFDCVDPFQYVTVGVILRRHLDGTLPVLLEAMYTVLADYDPETLAEITLR